MIKFDDVTFQYHYDEFPLLRNASFALTDEPNTLLCDVQSGKTTICKLILGMLRPQSGEVSVDGANVISCRPDALWLPAEPVFFENKTVRYNLEYPVRIRKILPQSADLLAKLSREFALDGLLPAKVGTLNPGERRKLALARGLSVSRRIVLFDGFFDNTNSEHFRRIAEMYFRDWQTVVQLTSFPQKAFGRTVIVSDKKCVFEGTADSAREFAKSLLWLGEKRADLG